MTTLEIIMLVIGIVCFITSFVLTKDDAQPAPRHKANYKPELSQKDKEELNEQIEKVISQQISDVEDSTQEALIRISNTKIMEMNEYVEGILEEINKNHNETVFMYDMLNEKAKEVKDILKQVNSIKTECEASFATSREDSAYLEKLIKDAGKTIKEMDIAIKAAYKTKNVMMSMVEETENQYNNVITPQFADHNQQDTEYYQEQYDDVPVDMQVAEPETEMTSNYNEQILLMHSQGRSNLEIAKTLNIGMGEVKLVIDLFQKNR